MARYTPHKIAMLYAQYINERGVHHPDYVDYVTFYNQTRKDEPTLLKSAIALFLRVGERIILAYQYSETW